MKKLERKKRIQRVIINMFFCLMFISLIFAPVYTVQAAKTKISSDKITMTVGDSKKLSLKRGSKNISKTAKWTSSKKSVAKVSNTGKVTAKAAGKTTIKAKYKKKTYKCAVTVLAAPKLSNSRLTIKTGSTSTIYLKQGNNTLSSGVRWMSSNSTVASVSGGKIKPIKPGTATITATYKKKIYSCYVTVVRGEVLTISKQSMELYKGDEATLTINNLLASDTVSWKSNKESIVEINGKGIIKAKNEGTAKITAQVKGVDTDYFLSCDVSVLSLDADAVISFMTVDGGAYIRGESAATVKFSLNKPSKNIKVTIKNIAGAEIYSKYYDTLTANNEQVFTWKTETLGSYFVEIKAGETISKSDKLTVYEQEFAAGTGSISNPFQISTLEQFNLIDKYSSYHFVQINDIDGKLNTFSGIAVSDNMFSGSYDGNGYRLSNIFILDNDDQTVALFKYVAEGASINNLTIDNFYITSEKYAGVFVESNYGMIQNCCINESNVTSGKYAGVFVDDNYGTIQNCYVNKCNVTTSSGSGSAGIFCAVNRNTGTIMNCKITDSTISSTYESYYPSTYTKVGGICGTNYGKIVNTLIETSSIKATSTWGKGAYIGGITCENHGNILNCTVSKVDTLTAYYDNYNKGTRDTEAIFTCINDGTLSNCSYSDMKITTTITKNTGIYIE